MQFINKQTMQQKLEKLLGITFDFSIEIISLCKELTTNNNMFLLTPLFQSTTKMGISINEALEFQANRTFMAKLANASNEAREALYWLRRIERDKAVPSNTHTCIDHCELIIRQITSAINA
jgi:four helix bundle protein